MSGLPGWCATTIGWVVLMTELDRRVAAFEIGPGGYALALTGQWQATPEERTGADPEILAAMDDLTEIPPEKIPERVAKAMAAKKPVEPPAVAMANLRKLEEAGIPVVMGTDAGNIGTLHGPSIFREMRMMAEAGLTPLQVLRSAAGHYIGTFDGGPVTRESVEYFPTDETARHALETGAWTQRRHL